MPYEYSKGGCWMTFNGKEDPEIPTALYVDFWQVFLFISSLLEYLVPPHNETLRVLWSTLAL